jgi:hypothetical protein
MTTPNTPTPSTNRTADPNPRALAAAALAYAARGWHVLPLRPGGKRPAFPDHPADRCTLTDPRCRAAGRHVSWQDRATTDPDRITRAWSTPTPTGPYGIGIACGPSGLVVVDLDVPKPDQTEPPPGWRLPGVVDGADVFTHLTFRHHGEDHPDTHTVATGRGGRHLYYAHPTGHGRDRVRLANTAGALGWLVDTRGWGGYVVAPPTVVDGNAYRVIVRAAAAPLPDWIAHALRPTPQPHRTAVSGPHTAPANGSRADAYARGALTREAAHVRAATHPGRNHALFVAAANLGELAAAGALTEVDARTVLLEAAAVHIGVHDFTATEARTAITSGLAKGATRPRRTTGQAA